ncbi:hypothetical protein Btru_058133 [Bulinus truncatus]|nr:hypothetical protein Btru_058133 [Bulinus truncatus]
MDYELHVPGEFNMPRSPCMGPPRRPQPRKRSRGPIPFYNGVGAVQKGRPRKRKSPMSDGDGCPPLAIQITGSEVAYRGGWGWSVEAIRPTAGLVVGLNGVPVGGRYYGGRGFFGVY